MKRGLEPLCSVSKPSIKASGGGGGERRERLDKNGRNSVAPVRNSDKQIPGVLCLLEELECPRRFLWKIFSEQYILPPTPPRIDQF